MVVGQLSLGELDLETSCKLDWFCFSWDSQLIGGKCKAERELDRCHNFGICPCLV